jgi:hypothetical protein
MTPEQIGLLEIQFATSLVVLIGIVILAIKGRTRR